MHQKNLIQNNKFTNCLLSCYCFSHNTRNQRQLPSSISEHFHRQLVTTSLFLSQRLKWDSLKSTVRFPPSNFNSSLLAKSTTAKVPHHSPDCSSQRLVISRGAVIIILFFFRFFTTSEKKL